MTQITMIVPMYNDQESLNVLAQSIDELDQDKFLFLIVDNGSRELLRLPKPISQKIEILRIPNNIGFGGGILAGAKVARTEWIGWMPGNLKISPSDVPKIVQNFDFHSGSILKCNRVDRPLIAQLKTLMAGIVQSYICRTNMLETGGTPTICEKSFLMSLKNPPLDYVFESFVLFSARKQKMNVVRPAIHYGPRLFGNSHWQSGLSAEIRLMKAIIKGRQNWD